MNKQYFIEKLNILFDNSEKNIIRNQIENYFEALKNYKLPKSTYKIGDEVTLKKGTFMHGTYKNIDGLIEIADNGFIASQFANERLSKYPSCVGVWNLKKDINLKDYINLYSGGTIRYNLIGGETLTEVIPYNKMNDLNNILTKKDFYIWSMEQTKEVRFMPSYSQNKIQIAFVINTDNKFMEKVKKYDILSCEFDESKLKGFVNKDYYEKFLKDRKIKDDFFTDRESAILFGFPQNFIEGVLVGRNYEYNLEILKIIKEKLPSCYICNLDGKIIVE